MLRFGWWCWDRFVRVDSVKSGEISEGWEAKVDALAGEGVTVEHAME